MIGARAVGCPAICRDEIKEGMAHLTPGFVPGPGDELTRRTLPVFFGVLELLLRAEVGLRKLEGAVMLQGGALDVGLSALDLRRRGRFSRR